MISVLEMAEAILKTWKIDGGHGPDYCSHCNQLEQAPLWNLTHSQDCIVLKCEHLKKMSTQNLMDDHPKIDLTRYEQLVGRIERR